MQGSVSSAHDTHLLAQKWLHSSYSYLAVYTTSMSHTSLQLYYLFLDTCSLYQWLELSIDSFLTKPYNCAKFDMSFWHDQLRDILVLLLHQVPTCEMCLIRTDTENWFQCWHDINYVQITWQETKLHTHYTQYSNSCTPTISMFLFFHSCRWQSVCAEHNLMLENRKAMPDSQTVTKPGTWSSNKEFAIWRSCTWQTNLKQSWCALSTALPHTKTLPRQIIHNRNVFDGTLQCRH